MSTIQLEENKIAFSFTDAVRGRTGLQYTVDAGTSLSQFLGNIDFPTNIENVIVIVNGKVYNGETYAINANDSIAVSSKKQAGGCD